MLSSGKFSRSVMENIRFCSSFSTRNASGLVLKSREGSKTVKKKTAN